MDASVEEPPAWVQLVLAIANEDKFAVATASARVSAQHVSIAFRYYLFVLQVSQMCRVGLPFHTSSHRQLRGSAWYADAFCP